MYTLKAIDAARKIIEAAEVMAGIFDLQSFYVLLFGF